MLLLKSDICNFRDCHLHLNTDHALQCRTAVAVHNRSDFRNQFRLKGEVLKALKIRS